MQNDGDRSITRANRVQQVIDDCVRRRAAGEALADEAVIAAHPELMPELADALRGLAIVGGAFDKLQAGPADSIRVGSSNHPEKVTLGATHSAASSRTDEPAGTGFTRHLDVPHGGKASADSRGSTIIPPSLGPVRVLRELGRGGMGAVFLGHHQLLHRDVAVKFMLNACMDASDPNFEQFLKGAQAAASVRHAGLTAIHHADLFEGMPYLVMEYIDGPTLADLLRRDGKLSVPAALAAEAATAEAVAALHDANIVRRDIKPANVLLDGQGRVYVTDFGLALNRPQTGGDSGLATAGTVPYMAPEMFDGLFSPRSDVYSLGIMLFELLTGKPPFRGTTLAEWRRCHAEHALPIDALTSAGVPSAVIELIERATHKNPVFRYKSALQFLAALRSGDAASMGLGSGIAELAALAYQLREPVRGAPDRTSETAADYFDVLASRASTKRERRDEPADAPALLGPTRLQFDDAPAEDGTHRHPSLGHVIPFWRRTLVSFGAWLLIALIVIWAGYGVRRAAIRLSVPRTAEVIGVAAGWLYATPMFSDEPAWFPALDGISAAAELLAPLLAALYCYHRLTYHDRFGDGNTYCGCCGYILRGLRGLRCPECGNNIGAGGDAASSYGRLVRSRRFRLVLRASAVALVVCAALCVLHPVLKLVVYGTGTMLVDIYGLPHEVRFGPAVAFLPPMWARVAAFIMGGFVVALPLLAATAPIYDRLVRSWVWQDGITRCGRCGETLENLTEPRCGRCRCSI